MIWEGLIIRISNFSNGSVVCKVFNREKKDAVLPKEKNLKVQEKT